MTGPNPLVNLCQLTTATTGTGTITLGAASSGYRGTSALTNGTTYSYSIIDGTNYELGQGAYTSSGTTLTRGPVQSSSANAAITLSGTAIVIVGDALAWDISAFKDAAAAPSSPTEGDRFFDNTSGISYTYITDANGSQWVETSAAGTPTNGVFSTMALGGATLGSNALAVSGTTNISSTLNFGGFAAEGTVVAAATTDLGTSTANRQSVTGNTTITGFGTTANSYRIIRFTGTPLLTYNATSLITPTGGNIQVGVGDTAILTSDGSSNWTIVSYTPYGGTKVVSSTSLTASGTFNIGSLALKAGCWILSASYFYSGYHGNSIGVAVGPNSGSFTGTVNGQSRGFINNLSGGVGYISTQPFKVTLAADATYYGVASNNDSPGYPAGNGIFTAQRVVG